MTEKQIRVLRVLSNGRWWSMRDVNCATDTKGNAVLDVLARRGLVEHGWPQCVHGIAAGWRITPAGIASVTKFDTWHRQNSKTK